MHDRRIEGETFLFGNHGALWQNAMTWFDHKTGSIWTQPWGRALAGELKGTQLQILPFSLTPWKSWLEEHPDTLVLIQRGEFYGSQMPSDNFVAGVSIGDLARAYPYPRIAEEIIVNDTLGEIPLLIHTNPETRSIHVFIRQLEDGTTLTFSGDAETLIDDQTGSRWDPRDGLSLEGPLAGQGLREIPYISSFKADWRVFYRHTDFYKEE